MPCTAIEITRPETNKVVRLKIITQENESGAFVMIHSCGPDWIPSKERDVKYAETSEETIHKELRVAAAEKNQLVTEESTNPEWNPEGYVRATIE